MDFMLARLELLRTNYPIFFIMVIYPLIMGILNSIIYAVTSPGWTKLMANHPRIAAALQFLDSVGLSPIKAAIRIKTVITGKAWVPPVALTQVETLVTHGFVDGDVITIQGQAYKITVTSPYSFQYGGSVPSQPGIGTKIGTSTLMALTMIVITVVLSACALFTPSRQADLKDTGIDVGLCILEELGAGVPVEQIAQDCGNVALQDVLRIKAEKEHIEAKARRDQAAPAPSGSSCPR